MPKEPFDWKRWALGIAGTVVAAIIIWLGSTAWGLYNRVTDVEKENMRLEGKLAAAEGVNAAQQREIERLWDSLTDLWRDSSEQVASQ